MPSGIEFTTGEVAAALRSADEPIAPPFVGDAGNLRLQRLAAPSQTVVPEPTFGPLREPVPGTERLDAQAVKGRGGEVCPYRITTSIPLRGGLQ